MFETPAPEQKSWSFSMFKMTKLNSSTSWNEEGHASVEYIVVLGLLLLVSIGTIRLLSPLTISNMTEMGLRLLGIH